MTEKTDRQSEYKSLPDIIAKNLDILFVGYNPGMESARVGHHYAGRSNRFWKLLYESRLTPVRLKPEEDRRLLEFAFGSTIIVGRPTKSSDEISPAEFSEGSKVLESLIKEISPRIVCYVGIGLYRTFASNIIGIPESRLKIKPGKQESNLFDGVTDYVCSNPSGLNTIPYDKQLECFIGLKNCLDSDKGTGTCTVQY